MKGETNSNEAKRKAEQLVNSIWDRNINENYVLVDKKQLFDSFEGVEEMLKASIESYEHIQDVIASGDRESLLTLNERIGDAVIALSEDLIKYTISIEKWKEQMNNQESHES